MPDMWVSKGGAWKMVTDAWVSKGGQWKQVTDLYTSKSGAWKSGWAGELIIDQWVYGVDSDYQITIYLHTAQGASKATIYWWHNNVQYSEQIAANSSGVINLGQTVKNLVPNGLVKIWGFVYDRRGNKVNLPELKYYVPPLPGPPAPVTSNLSRYGWTSTVPAISGASVRYAWRSYATGPVHYRSEPYIQWGAAAGTSWKVQCAYEQEGVLSQWSPATPVTTLTSGYTPGTYYLISGSESSDGKSQTFSYYENVWKPESFGLWLGVNVVSGSALLGYPTLFFDFNHAASKAVKNAYDQKATIKKAFVWLTYAGGDITRFQALTAPGALKYSVDDRGPNSSLTGYNPTNENVRTATNVEVFGGIGVAAVRIPIEPFHAAILAGYPLTGWTNTGGANLTIHPGNTGTGNIQFAQHPTMACIEVVIQ